MLGDLFRYFRHTVRMLARSPGSSVAAVVAMALGIGLCASMYGILDGILLRGLPFEEPQRIMHLERNNLSQGQDSLEVPHHDFADWRAQQQSFEGLAGFTSGTFNLADEGLPDRYNGSWISANFLDLLRVDPLLGRGFLPEDEEEGAPPVVLLGYQVWKNRYARDPDVVGSTIRVNSEPTTVVGVLPEGFRFPVDQDVWAPLKLDLEAPREPDPDATLEVFGRLRDGVTLDRAILEMNTIAQRLAQEYPESNEGVGAVVKPYVEEFAGGDTISLLETMMLSVLLVLLIACFNVANLLIGRASLRRRELAIRTALGSGRWRAVFQVLGEALVVAAAGAAVGLFLAHLGLRAFDAAVRQMDVPFWFSFYLSARVVLFTVAVTALAAVVAGLVPALQASRPDVTQVLQDSVRGTTSFRLGWVTRTLVILEVALSCALLLATGLTIRSIVAANSFDLVFHGDHVLSARLGLFEGDYPDKTDWSAFFDRLLTRLRSEGEIDKVAIGTAVPTDTAIGSGWTRIRRPGETYDHPWQAPGARFNSISPGYFDALEVPFLAGRDFTSADRLETPRVAIVNQRFADKEWPGENPIGKRVQRYLTEEEKADDPAGEWLEVVGMVPDLRFAEFDNDDDQQGIYVPVAQVPPRFAWIVVKTRGEPGAFKEPLRRAVLDVDPDLPLYFVRTMPEVLERTMFYHNLLAVLFSIFGAAAVVLACVGLYGVMAFSVTQRIQEMGVRMALGARTRDIVGMVLRQGLVRVAIGLVLGLALGAGLGQALVAVLYSVGAVDPVTFVAIPVLLAAIALLACVIPARKASSVDPVAALRYE